jgi:hypothetical protein
MRSKSVAEKTGQPLYLFVLLVLVFACMALTGCGKNCANYEKELNVYADGSKPITEAAKVLKECADAQAKCPKLAVPFEVMGDIDARDEKLEEADKNYDRALALQKDNQRVIAKKEMLSAAMSEAGAKAFDAKIESITRISLSQYATVEESLRLAWCERAIGNPTKYAFVHMSPGNSFVPQFSGSPADLDRLLMDLVQREPQRQTFDAAAMMITLATKKR